MVKQAMNETNNQRYAFSLVKNIQGYNEYAFFSCSLFYNVVMSFYVAIKYKPMITTAYCQHFTIIVHLSYGNSP